MEAATKHMKSYEPVEDCFYFLYNPGSGDFQFSMLIFINLLIS